MKFNEYDYCVTAAGRVNLIGEHVDYCGGRVLPAALSLTNAVYVRPNGTNTINLSWTDLPDKISLDIDRLLSYKELKYAKYQAGSAYTWQQAGHKVVGCDMLFDCSIPFGSGLSSSAAIEVSTIAALATVAGESVDKVQAALAAQKAEHDFAGVNCGIMDQFVSAMGKKNNAVLLDCRTLDYEYVPLRLGAYRLVIANCKKPHNLVESRYNERRAETETALEFLKSKTELSCLADLTPSEFSHFGEGLPRVIKKRAKHVVEECERVLLAVTSMKNKDMKRLGDLLNQSHASLRDLYEVTGSELDALAAAAQSHPACIGSRMTGAGFGGCTISLVHKDGVEDFKTYVAKAYEEKTGYRAEFYNSDIADGLTVTKK